jgi:hypothetical protein
MYRALILAFYEHLYIIGNNSGTVTQKMTMSQRTSLVGGFKEHNVKKMICRVFFGESVASSLSVVALCVSIGLCNWNFVS